MAERYRFALPGCRTEPLAAYLKGLAVFRLVAEQRDPTVRAWWEHDTLHLETSLDQEALLQFFLYDYEPSPIVSPWNKDFGILDPEKELPLPQQAGAARLRRVLSVVRLASTDPVLEALGLALIAAKPPEPGDKSYSKWSSYREAMSPRARALYDLAVARGKAKEQLKAAAFRRLRALLPDEDLGWLDAVAVVHSDAELTYPPLLGSGGNDGRLELSSKFLESLVGLFDAETGEPAAQTPVLLRASLLDEAFPGLQKVPIGQFHPGHAGGANATLGPDADPVANPWDFVFALEGSLLFAASQVRRGEVELGGAAIPFSVETIGAGAAGIAAVDGERDQNRREFWTPVWARPASLREVRHVLSEGRVMVGRKAAVSALDFARAVGRLGVDRGIDSFVRYAFLKRRGKAFNATPLGVWPVQRNPRIALLDELDSWLDRLGWYVRQAGNIPGSHVQAGQAVLDAAFAVARASSPERWQRLLAALAEVDRLFCAAEVHAPDSSEKARRLRFVPWLSAGWAVAAAEDTPEFRLALSAASMWPYRLAERRYLPHLRGHLVHLPSSTPRPYDYAAEPTKQVVWRPGKVTESLGAMVALRLRLSSEAEQKTAPLGGSIHARPDDLERFLRGEIAWSRFESLLAGLSLIGPNLKWEELAHILRPVRGERFSDAPYALAKLALLPFHFKELTGSDEVRVPVDGRIASLLLAGRGREALELAARRLRQVGVAVLDGAVVELPPERAKRLAAALLFPVGSDEARGMWRLVTRKGRKEERESASNETSEKKED